MDEHRLLSPEKIYLDLNLAGVGSRFAAFFIDVIFIVFIDLAIICLFGLALFLAFRGRGHAGGPPLPSFTWSFAVTALLVVAASFGYFVFFETVRSGQTPGKGFFKIRVIQDSGAPATFSKILIRNILRIIDVLPTTYVVGIIAILISRKNQRLGDMAAGTIVVRDNVAAAPAAIDLEVIEQPWSPAARLRLHEITEADFAVLKAFLLRHKTMPPEMHRDLESKLVLFFCQKLALDPGVTGNPSLFLEQVAALYQRRGR